MSAVSPDRWRAARRALFATAVTAAVLGVLMLLAVTFSDSMAVGRHLSDEASSKSSMYCVAGAMSRQDDNWFERLFGDASFQCADWRTRNFTDLPNSPARRH
jgi:hypothetical protein